MGSVFGRAAVARAPLGVAAALLLSSEMATAESPMVLNCAGAFARGSDEAALAGRFGRSDVVSAELDAAEGSTERGTVLFPRDPARRVEIFWHDPGHRRRPASVIVRGRGGWTLSPVGQGAGPIAVGTSLAAVEKANGRPFTLIGFGWDMGGYGGGWRGGRLEAAPGGCSLSLRFDPAPRAASAAVDKVSGDRRFSSADPAIRAVAPTVSQVSIEWPE